MEHIAIQKQSLRRQIMRRIWYGYAISLAAHPFLWHGMLLGGGLVLLRELVWLRRVWDSFLSVPVGEAPIWISERLLGAVADGEFLLLLTLGVLTMTTLSLGGRIWRRFTALTTSHRSRHWQAS